MIAKALRRIEDVTAPFWQWCAGFLGILFVRFFLENLSSPAPSFPGTPDAATLVHYFLFYVTIFISFSLVLYLFIPDLTKITKFLFFGLPIIWLPPIVDLIVSHGGGYHIAYIFPENIGALWNDFLRMGGSSPLGGVTPGLRAELIAILAGSLAYAFVKTKSVIKSIGAAFSMYLVWFFLFVFPALIAAAARLWAGGSPVAPLLSSLTSGFLSSHLLPNFIKPNLLPSYVHATEIGFNIGTAAIFYLFDFILIAYWAFLCNPRTVAALVHNVRPGRTAYYLGMIVLGVIIAEKLGPASAFTSWVDFVLFLVLLLAYFSAFLFAVGMNDLADVKIDRISNSHRPLPSGILREADIANSNVFFLTSSLIGGFISGYWTLFAIAVFTAAYYIYSAPPLRLKRIPFISTFLIAIATLGTLMAGFYFADANKLVSDFPIRLVALILICITLAVNFKDIKDVAGDRADNVWTIPVIFGEERGKQIVGILLAAAFLAVPVILANWLLFLPSLAAAILGYIFSIAKNYREWKIFVLYFLYLAVVGAILL
ncbi:MAG: UbiA family prenyltransferase [Minisyncoccia bacterium]|jgi:4-hydroxybenzoate polyprenyltransferase